MAADPVSKPDQLEMRDIAFVAQIPHLEELKQNDTSFNRTGVKPLTKIAVIEVGCADGYHRRFSNGVGSVNMHGVMCPIVGNVCMDMTMVDATNTEAQIGDEVILFGNDPTVSDLANKINTIPYEVLTGIGERVKRVYYSS